MSKNQTIPPIEEMFAPCYEIETIGGWVCLSMCYSCGGVILVSDSDPWGKKRHHEWHSGKQTKKPCASTSPS